MAMAAELARHTRVPTIVEGAARTEVEDLIIGQGDVYVTDEAGRLVGRITEADLGDDATGRTAGDLARPADSVTPEAPIEDVIDLMRSNRLHRLPIVSRERIVGVLDLSDLEHSHYVTHDQLESVRQAVLNG